MKKLSIIIPCYNVEKFIKKCIESIEKQTYNDLEIIIVDDGSNDNTLKIVKELKKKYKNITIIEQRNSGVSIARNNALKVASGDLITFVDADDFLENDMYEKMINKMEEESADIISCNYNVIVENEIVRQGKNDETVLVYEGQNNIMKAFFKQKISGIAVWNKIFKKNIVEMIHFENELKHYEDKVFLYKACKEAKKVILYNISKYNYVKNDKSASSKIFDISYLDILDAQNIICKQENEFEDLSKMDLSNTYLSLIRMMIISEEYKRYKDLYYDYIQLVKKTKYKQIRNMNKKEMIETLVLKTNKKLYEILIKIRKR